MTQEPGESKDSLVEKLPPITESQRRAFDELVDLLNHNYVDVRSGIVTAKLGGHQVAVVVAVPYDIDVHDPDAEFDLHPAAILLDDDTLDRLGDLLQPPDGVEVIDERDAPGEKAAS